MSSQIMSKPATEILSSKWNVTEEDIIDSRWAVRKLSEQRSSPGQQYVFESNHKLAGYQWGDATWTYESPSHVRVSRGDNTENVYLVFVSHDWFVQLERERLEEYGHRITD